MRISTMLAAAIAAILWTAPLTDAGEDAVPLCGDVNETGSITTTDALLVLQKGVGRNVDLSCGDFESSLGVCQETLASTETAVETCNSDLARLRSTFTRSLTFQSTVTYFYDVGEPTPGVALGDTISVALVADLSSAEFLGADPCGKPGCWESVWEFPAPVSYAATFSSGHIEPGWIDRIVIIEGGYDEYGIEQDDKLQFELNAAEVFTVIDIHGFWKATKTTDDLFDALGDIAAHNVFDLAFFDVQGFSITIGSLQEHLIVTNTKAE